jgi:hypothetical protein
VKAIDTSEFAFFCPLRLNIRTAYVDSWLIVDSWRSWLMHYATSRKIVGPSPDEVIDIFKFT